MILTELRAVYGGGGFDSNAKPDFSKFSDNGSQGGGFQGGGSQGGGRSQGNGGFQGGGSQGGGLPNGLPINPSSLGNLGSMGGLVSLFAKFLGGGSGGQGFGLTAGEFSSDNIEAYCSGGLAISMIPQSESASTSGKQIGIFQRLHGVNMTICIGDNQHCASPHSSRLITQDVSQSGSEGFLSISSVLSDNDLKLISSKKNQANKQGLAIFSVEGLLRDNNSDKAFRCLSTLKSF